MSGRRDSLLFFFCTNHAFSGIHNNYPGPVASLQFQTPFYLLQLDPDQAETLQSCKRDPFSPSCALPEALSTDLMVADGPCQPYSTKSGTRAAGGDPRDHDLYHVMFGDHDSIPALVRLILPHRLSSEQVGGFKNAYSKEDPTTPLQAWGELMLGIKRGNGKQHFAAMGSVKVCCSGLVTVVRERNPIPNERPSETNASPWGHLCVVMASPTLPPPHAHPSNQPTCPATHPFTHPPQLLLPTPTTQV